MERADDWRKKRIAAWLVACRQSQTMPDRNKPWTQEHLLERMHAEIDWAPHRPNYSKYENAKAAMEPETLDQFVAFWAHYDLPGPDLTPIVPVPPLDPLLEIVKELRLWRQEDRRRIGELEATVARLTQTALAGSGSAGRTVPDAQSVTGQ